jgi:hypothetical protein
MPFPEDVAALAAEVRNWGRWGPDDQLGTLNLIDADAQRRGAACVRDGKAFSLAIPLSADGPQLGFVPGRKNPVHTMFAIDETIGVEPGAQAWNDDALEMGTQSYTHWDLEELAADCADDGRYTLLLSASPEPVLRGVGAPVNPVAVK